MSRLLLGFALLTLVSACGVKGDLARPDPLWNREDAIRAECARQAAQHERQDPRCAPPQTEASPPPQP
jgi:Prokaryotic lipoprotein-attachment site